MRTKQVGERGTLVTTARKHDLKKPIKMTERKKTERKKSTAQSESNDVDFFGGQDPNRKVTIKISLRALWRIKNIERQGQPTLLRDVVHADVIDEALDIRDMWTEGKELRLSDLRTPAQARILSAIQQMQQPSAIDTATRQFINGLLLRFGATEQDIKDLTAPDEVSRSTARKPH